MVPASSGSSLRDCEVLHSGAVRVDPRKLQRLWQKPTSSSGSEFLFSHIFAFSFIPAFAAGLVNAKFKNRIAEFVWLVPAVILGYKFFTFHASSVFQHQFSGAVYQYFGGGFSIPEFRDWHEFWSIVASNPDTLRGRHGAA